MVSSIYYIIRVKTALGTESIISVLDKMYYEQAKEYIEKMNKESVKTGLTYSLDIVPAFDPNNINYDVNMYKPY